MKNNLPVIKVPETMTAQDMWSFKFQEIQKIESEHLNPIRLKVNNFNSNYLLTYRSILKTYSQQFTAFLYKDFNEERSKINRLFDEFQKNYNEAERLKKHANTNFGKDNLNSIHKKCLDTLTLIDDTLEIIRQSKGFGMREQVSFVINDRARKALTINSNIGAEILKIFNKNQKQITPKESVLKNVNKVIDNKLVVDKVDEDEDVSSND